MSGEQEGLPEGWASTTLPELAHGGGVYTDGDWVESKDQDPDGDVRLIQLADIGDGYYRDRSSRFLTSEKAEELNCTFLDDGDILISRMADPLGRACLFPGDPKRSVTVVDVAVFRCGSHAVADHGWLKNWINATQFRRSIDLKSSGTTRKRISRKNLGSIDLPLPPLNEQRRIVAKIESLQARSEAAKEALDAIPPLLEKFRQSVLAAAFRGDLTASWRAKNPDVEPASVLLERIRAERRTRWIEDAAEKGRARAEVRARKAGKPWTAADDAKVLDKERVKAAKKYQAPDYSSDPDAPTASAFGPYESLGWAAAPLEALVDGVRAVPYGIVKTGDPFDGGIPTVRCGDIKGFHINIAGLKRVHPDLHNQYSRTALVGGEVLVAVRGTIGATAVVGDDMVGMNISREVAMIPCLPGVTPKYLCYLLASPVGQSLMQGHVKGVAQSGINLGDLRQLPMPLPPVAEQEAIVTAVEDALRSMSVVAQRMRNNSAAVERLNQSILARAFRGELVPQDPTDEPASVLLERIRAEREAAEAVKKASKKKRGRKGR